MALPGTTRRIWSGFTGCARESVGKKRLTFWSSRRQRYSTMLAEAMSEKTQELITQKCPLKIAEKLLGECRYPEEKASQILYAIRVHRFSQHRTPGTLEAKILQDADRIDISGAIGVAMAFAYGGAKNMELYDTADPLAKNRELDDDRYVLDHFQKKLLKLGETIHTETGRQLVKRRQKYLASFVTQFIREIG